MAGQASDASFYRKRILHLLGDREAIVRVEEYLDPTEPFAAFSFDTAGHNPPYDLSSDDLLALNFLDAPIGPMTYRRLMELRPEIASYLRKLSLDLHLWHLKSDSQQAYEDAKALWRLLVKQYGIGPARASKIMARKRPKLIPILDRRVRRFYDSRTHPFWLPLAGTLRDRYLRERIERELRPPGIDTSSLSLLRILDIAIWTHVGACLRGKHPNLAPHQAPSSS